MGSATSDPTLPSARTVIEFTDRHPSRINSVTYSSSASYVNPAAGAVGQARSPKLAKGGGAPRSWRVRRLDTSKSPVTSLWAGRVRTTLATVSMGPRPEAAAI